MTRQSRKRYERIHTRRAQTGFPRVSKAILHNDGTITPVNETPEHRFKRRFERTFTESRIEPFITNVWPEPLKPDSLITRIIRVIRRNIRTFIWAKRVHIFWKVLKQAITR